MITQPPEIPSYILHCQMKQEPAALERLCQVIRIRGFRVTSMVMESHGETLAFNLVLEGYRSISMLQTQLEKLHTVYTITGAWGHPAISGATILPSRSH